MSIRSISKNLCKGFIKIVESISSWLGHKVTQLRQCFGCPARVQEAANRRFNSEHRPQETPSPDVPARQVSAAITPSATPSGAVPAAAAVATVATAVASAAAGAIDPRLTSADFKRTKAATPAAAATAAGAAVPFPEVLHSGVITGPLQSGKLLSDDHPVVIPKPKIACPPIASPITYLMKNARGRTAASITGDLNERILISFAREISNRGAAAYLSDINIYLHHGDGVTFTYLDPLQTAAERRLANGYILRDFSQNSPFEVLPSYFSSHEWRALVTHMDNVDKALWHLISSQPIARSHIQRLRDISQKYADMIDLKGRLAPSTSFPSNIVGPFKERPITNFIKAVLIKRDAHYQQFEEHFPPSLFPSKVIHVIAAYIMSPKDLMISKLFLDHLCHLGRFIEFDQKKLGSRSPEELTYVHADDPAAAVVADLPADTLVYRHILKTDFKLEVLEDMHPWFPREEVSEFLNLCQTLNQLYVNLLKGNLYSVETTTRTGKEDLFLKEEIVDRLFDRCEELEKKLRKRQVELKRFHRLMQNGDRFLEALSP